LIDWLIDWLIAQRAWQAAATSATSQMTGDRKLYKMQAGLQHSMGQAAFQLHC